ncbi:MAG: UDP-N-acetyl-D-mannosamine dehydrogenase [Candidatus Bathyarchaeota archaeon BA2]|nr:MAG: UDP-N-acetyl-D-mannosamine dehydrogenase [Candidatus Bathyarchaeota archaeon BA2]
MEIVVIGMGYAGISTAAMFANEGFNVIGVQRKSKRSGWKIDYLNAGKCPIGGDEPGLAELIEKVVRKGSFRVTDDISVCKKADVIIIVVQTPVDEKHEPQYNSLKEVSQAVGRHMKKGVMIIESTVAPGTTNHIIKPILEESSGMKAGRDFNLVYSYERVMIGRLLHNLVYMPRIVGGLTPECTQRGVKFYRNIVKAELFPTDCLTAEVAKVTENTYRDVNIAFANEVALICESLGVNVHEVRRFVNSLPNDPSDPAKNPYRMMHIPGAGTGGHCLPKDPWLLKYSLDAYGGSKFTPKILVESRRINDFMPQHMKDLVEEALHEKGVKLQDARVCILGLAFLGDSDDTRNTPALPLYNLLKGVCKEVVVHDPFVKEFEGVVLTDDLEDALRNKDCMVIVTRHKEYVDIRLDWLKSVLATLVIVDGRNVFNPKDCEDAGFSYRGVGIGVRVKAK